MIENKLTPEAEEYIDIEYGWYVNPQVHTIRKALNDPCLLKAQGLYTREQWIKVSDRLPEVDEFLESDVVIICYEDKVVSIGTFVKEEPGRWLDRIWHTRWDNGKELNVTHWTPLPEPARD